MKVYGVGDRRIGVYETRDIHPDDAVTAVVDDAAICLVDRIVDFSGAIDARSMTEAVNRHDRVKMAPPGLFTLRFHAPPAAAPPGLADRLRALTVLYRRGGSASEPDWAG